MTTRASYRFFPGFPFTASDYEPLTRALRDYGVPESVRVAHSLGCIDALGDTPRAGPLVLLAPSHPHRRRPGRRAMATVLLLLGHIPVLAPRLAAELRRRSFAAFDLAPVPGRPLPLRDAAHRLVKRQVTVLPREDVLVVTSPEDPRHQEQLELADQLGARVVLTKGGHMFPISQPIGTARLIASTLGPDAHPSAAS